MSAGVIGTPPRWDSGLYAGQIVMAEGEPFPGYVTGFNDDGGIGVWFASGHRRVTRKQITWRQTWRGYGESPYRVPTSRKQP